MENLCDRSEVAQKIRTFAFLSPPFLRNSRFRTETA